MVLFKNGLYAVMLFTNHIFFFNARFIMLFKLVVAAKSDDKILRKSKFYFKNKRDIQDWNPVII